MSKKLLYLSIAFTLIFTGCGKLDSPSVIGGGSEDSSTLSAVDLGLSVKWANMNVGASSIYDTGEYFAWGEKSGKQTYDEENYIFHMKDAHYVCETYMKNLSGDYELMSTQEETEKVYSRYWTKDLPKEENSLAGDIIKYVYKWIDFFPDKLNKLLINKKETEKSDDCAAAMLGSGWRMPTKAECMELASKCKIEIKVKEGYQSVIELVGPNGNYIDFPVHSGYKENNAKRSTGLYIWSSELDTDDPEKAFAMYFGGSSYDCRSVSRIIGLAVRAVRE